MKINILKQLLIIIFLSILLIQIQCSSSKNITYSSNSPFVGKWEFTFYSQNIVMGRTFDIIIQKDGSFSKEIYIGKLDFPTSSIDPYSFKLEGGVYDNGKIEGNLYSKGIMATLPGGINGKLTNLMESSTLGNTGNTGEGNYTTNNSNDLSFSNRGIWKAVKKY